MVLWVKLLATVTPWVEVHHVQGVTMSVEVMQLILSVVLPVCASVFGAVAYFDRRIDTIESKIHLVEYRIDQMESDRDHREERIHTAVSHISNFLASNTSYSPRFTQGNNSWPSDDPPTQFKIRR